MCSLFYIYLKSLQYVFVILWVLACSTQPCAASSICSEDSYLNKEDLQMTELCNKAHLTSLSAIADIASLCVAQAYTHTPKPNPRIKAHGFRCFEFGVVVAADIYCLFLGARVVATLTAPAKGRKQS